MNSSLIRRAFWLFLFSSVALSEDAYRFTFNGKEVTPWVIKVNGPEPVTGDVAQIEDFFFCLDGPGHYDLETDAFDCLNRKSPDGGTKRIACKISAPAEEGGDPSARLFRRRKPGSDVAIGFTADEVKELRGIRIGDWSPSLESWLGRLDLKHVCIYLDSGALGGIDQPAIPKLPPSLRHLILDSGGSWGCKDLSPLVRLPDLRFLSLDDASPSKVDLKLLSRLPLEYLSLPSYVPFENLAALQSVSTLKTLAANSCLQIGDASFLSGITGLRQVFLRHISGFPEAPAKPLELAALGKLRHLAVFEAANSTVASLPTEPMPALRAADILLCGLGKESVDAFVRANPQARIRYSLNSELQGSLTQADRLRVRSGGVCHRDEATEKTIFSSSVAAEVAEIAGRFQVTEENSGGHCICCGDPTFEFYKGDKLIAMLGFHHGRTIRWANGSWPGDGMMVASNSTFLIDWLEKHAYDGPKQEWLEQKRQEAAQRRRWQRYEAILPPPVAARLNTAKNWEEITAVLDRDVPKDVGGATLLLRLFGCDFGSWSHYSSMDSQLAEKLLPEFPADKLAEALIKAKPETEEGLGAVRWLFGEGKAEKWQDGHAKIEPLARFALTHPNQDNRWRCLTVMRNVGAPLLPLIREVMRKGTQPREMPKDELGETGGQVVFRPSYLDLPAGSSDQEVAAFCLQMLGDVETHAETERIRLGLPEAVKNGWQSSLENYRKEK